MESLVRREIRVSAGDIGRHRTKWIVAALELTKSSGSASDGDAVLYATGHEVFIGQVELLIPGCNLILQIFQICLKLAEHSFGPWV